MKAPRRAPWFLISPEAFIDSWSVLSVLPDHAVVVFPSRRTQFRAERARFFLEAERGARSAQEQARYCQLRVGVHDVSWNGGSGESGFFALAWVPDGLIAKTIVATALPTIVAHLHGGNNYSWVGRCASCFVLAPSGRITDGA